MLQRSAGGGPAAGEPAAAEAAAAGATDTAAVVATGPATDAAATHTAGEATEEPPRGALERDIRDHQSPLLALPDNVLHIIARKMGKRARLLCSQLRQLHGPPGACLRYPTPELLAGPIVLMPYTSLIASWHHPLRRLVLGDEIDVDAPAWRAIAASLPTLRELECSVFDPAPGASPARPLASLTALRAHSATTDLRAIPACAPHLHSLHITRYCPQGWGCCPPAPLAGVVCSAVAALSELRSLDLPLPARHLTCASFTSALHTLAALTHLGLDLTNRDVADPLAADAAAAVIAALAALPLLLSVRLVGGSVLGPTLGPALQALALRSLDLTENEDCEDADSPSIVPGYLPHIAAMPALEGLALAGKGLLECEDTYDMFEGAGSASLRALELRDMSQLLMPLEWAMVVGMPGLTSLRLRFDWNDYQGVPDHEDALLTDALSRLAPQLRHLEVCRSDFHGFLPGLAGLSALTALRLSFARSRMQAAELRAVARLSSLRRLAISGDVRGRRLAACMDAVRGLPLLEDLELNRPNWPDEEVLMLVPPPERLQRVRLVGSWPLPLAFLGALPALQLLERHGVDVAVRPPDSA